MKNFSGPCPVCNGIEFSQIDKILWQQLINDWQLSEYEVNYINRQQGFYCINCNNSLRALGLASAILAEYHFIGTLNEFSESHNGLSILEINSAGNLTPFLRKNPLHRIVEYPEYNMLDLQIESESFDLVIHSDTLEHVENPERALSECLRILKSNGRCIFTVPIIVDRLSRTRIGLSNSYHGTSSLLVSDLKVFTEFGVDIWKMVIKVGFTSCEFFSFEYPSALVLIAKK